MNNQYSHWCPECPSPSPQQGLSGYGQGYGSSRQYSPGSQMSYNSSSYGYGSNQYQNSSSGYTSSTSQYKGIHGGPQQQMSCPNGQCSPRVSVMPPGTQPDPNVKVIQLNWGDLLGTGSPSGQHNLNVAMLGGKGDLQTNAQGLKVTFNGEVPKGMPCHVMSINPYANCLGGNK